MLVFQPNVIEMSKEDAALSTNLQNLEISDVKHVKLKPNPDAITNPFMKRRRSKSLSSVNFGTSSCSCAARKQLPRVKNAVHFKSSSKGKKILREPILKLISNSKCSCDTKSASACKLFGQHGAGSDQEDFRSVVNACQQLSLANANDGVQDYLLPSFQSIRLAENKQAATTEASNSNAVASSNSSNSSSCSQQARMSGSPPCDVTIDELASYFETFVHIPKKMSSMAEMMYI